MIGIDDPTAVAVQPTPEAAGTAGFFTEGSPGVTPATKVRASWLNAIQNEMLSFLTDVSLTPVKTTYNQVLTAVKMMFQRSAPTVSAAGGTSDAITGSFTPAITALVNGMTLRLRAAAANTTTTPTFTPNSGTVTAKTIVKGAGAALAVGDIPGAGAWITLSYDSTLDKWVLLNPYASYPSSIGASGYMKFPNGMIFQWGKTASIGANSALGVTFPTAFPTAAVSIVITKENSDVTNEQTFDASSLGTAGVTITNTAAVAGDCWWNAWGY